jgi:hypothetical protein
LGCPLSSWGLAPDPDPYPQMRTGYRNDYEGGLCWEYLGFIYRGVVKFDLSQIKGEITNAHLDLICTGTNSTDGTPFCDGSVFVLDGPGSGFDNPCHLYVNLPAGGGNIAGDILKVAGPNIVIVVTDLVKAWVNGQQPNYGMLFLGNNESLSENNDRCISTFKVGGISVTYIPADCEEETAIKQNQAWPEVESRGLLLEINCATIAPYVSTRSPRCAVKSTSIPR